MDNSINNIQYHGINICTQFTCAEPFKVMSNFIS